MNPFLSRHFILLTLAFSLSFIFIVFVFVRDGTVDWQWEKHNENGILSQIMTERLLFLLRMAC